MRWVLISVFLSLSIPAISQDTTKHSWFKNDVLLQGGFFFQGYNDFKLNGFRKLTQGSSLSNKDLSIYSEEDNNCYHCYLPDAGLVLTLQTGFNFFNEKKKRIRSTQVRAGLFYYWNNFVTYDLVNRTTVTYDSVASDNSITCFDSVWSNGVFFRHDWKQLNADFSVLVGTSTRRIVSIAGGIGVSSGLIFNRSTSIHFLSYIDTISRETTWIPGNEYYYYSGNNKISDISETHKNKAGFNCIVYVPVEMNFNPRSQNHLFVRRIRFTLQARPGFHLVSLPETGTHYGFIIPFLAGMRFSF